MAKKQNKKQKAILVSAVVIAGLITIGGSFAWYTSQDSVTNRLSAKGGYDVEIWEEFNPPEQWTPGTDVKKQVQALNTGNVDAFVKLDLTNALTIKYKVKETTAPTTVDAADYVVLNKAQVANVADDYDTSNITTSKASDVQAIQASGILAYSTGDGLIYNPDKAVGTGYTEEQKETAREKANVGTKFLPKTTGLYVFARDVKNANETDARVGTDTATGKYTGYYYVAASSDTGGQGTYYELSELTATCDTANDLTTLTGFTAKYAKFTTVATTDLTFGDINTTSQTIPVQYKVGDDSVDLEIKLADDYATNWTASKSTDSKKYEFFYNHVLRDQSASYDLVESIKFLDKDTSSNPTVSALDFYDFTYDLKVGLDSAQVTYNKTTGDEEATAVTGWGKTPGLILTDGKITAVSWS